MVVFRTYSAPATIHPSINQSYVTQLHTHTLSTLHTSNLTMGTISIRKFIRWLPDEPSEPTTTFVITSPRLKRFVDLRILLPEGDSSWTGQDGTYSNTTSRTKPPTKRQLIYNRSPAIVSSRLGHSWHDSLNPQTRPLRLFDFSLNVLPMDIFPRSRR